MQIPKIKGIFCVVGSFLIHFSLGTIYTFGNISPYISSYLKFKVGINVVSEQMIWIYAFALASQGITMTFGGILNRKIGPKLTTLIGCWTMSLAVMLTYFSIKVNIYLTILTYGVFYGGGIGIAYSVAISTAIKWFPNRRGLVIGIVVAGFGLGSLVFNQIQTLYINPHNLSPNVTIGPDKYFNDEEILERIPTCFIIIGGIYAILQLIGSLLQFTPSIWEINETIVTVHVSENESSFNNLEETYENTCVIQSCGTEITPLESLKKRDFWVLWITLALAGTVNIFATSLYKTFGQIFIHDDYFLAIVGSIAAIFNALSRIFWGQIMDRYSYKIAMRTVLLITSLLIGTFYCCSLIQTETGAKVMHIIWVCGLLGNICGTFSLMPAATAKLFGTTNVATIYGMLFTANALASMVGAVTTSMLLVKIKYLGIFEIGAAMAILAFGITFLHSKKDL